MRHVIYDTDNRPKSRRILTYTAGPEDEGRPVRDIILYKWKLVAHDVARAKYETPDGITVDGEVVWVNRRLHEGNILRVVITDHAPDSIIPSEGRLDIVYEDEDLICINKPSGIVVHPSHGHYADSLANYLAYYFNEKGEPHEIRTIGRLDKDTSGLLLFGKSRSAVGLMDAQAAEGTRTKVYLALCEGEFAESEGYVDTPIMRAFDGNIKRVAKDGGDTAFTSYGSAIRRVCACAPVPYDRSYPPDPCPYEPYRTSPSRRSSVRKRSVYTPMLARYKNKPDRAARIDPGLQSAICRQPDRALCRPAVRHGSFCQADPRFSMKMMFSPGQALRYSSDGCSLNSVSGAKHPSS